MIEEIDQLARDGPDAGRRLRALAALALELAVLPAPDSGRLRDHLERHAPLLEGPVGGLDLSGLRLALVDLARALLDAGADDSMLARLTLARDTRAWFEYLFDRLGGPGADESRAADLLWTPEEIAAGAARTSRRVPRSAGAIAPALARDALDYADFTTDELADAHRFVRIFAVARRAARDREAGRVAGLELLDLPANVFSEGPVLESPAAEGAEETADPPAVSQLQSRIALIERIHWRLGTIGTDLDADRRMEGLAALARDLVGFDCLFLLLERHDALVVRGDAGLDGTTLGLGPERSAASAALHEAAPRQLSARTEGSVIDRQLARRLGADAVLALPMYTPEPVGVLMLPDQADRFGALALAAFAAPVLWTPLELGRRIDSASRGMRSRFEERLREVVHEANNPLSVIHNYLHILGSRLEDEATNREQLRLIGDEIRRTSDILQALVRTPGAGEEASSEPLGRVSPDELVTEVVGLMEPALMDAAGITLETELDAGGVDLRVDGARLRQVLLNLLKNAVEAMPEGGRIRVATRASVVTSFGPGIEITITDSGRGIAPDLLAQLFTMGSTTKGPGRGLGLGIVRRLIEEIGGTISAQSSEGVGTSFRILLPRS